METLQQFGFKELFTHIIGDMAKAICERNGETKQQQFTRSQAAVHTIMGFLPRDVIEAMLAGHCVMFHEVLTDSIHDTLRGEMDTMRRGTRANIVAMNKAFTINLDRLERYQNRPSDGRRDVPEVMPADVHAERNAPAPPMDIPAEAAIPLRTAPIAARTPSHEARKQAVPAQTPSAETPASAVKARTPPAETGNAPAQTQQEPLPSSGETPVVFYPSPEAIAACRANPRAMASLDAGDAEGFARAMGVDQPSEGYLAASAGSLGFADRHAPNDRSARAAAPPPPAAASGDDGTVGVGRDFTRATAPG